MRHQRYGLLLAAMSLLAAQVLPVLLRSRKGEGRSAAFAFPPRWQLTAVGATPVQELLAGRLIAGGAAAAALRALQRAALADTGSLILPTVDRDVGTFHQGRASGYAWVQTSETLYIFVPVKDEDSAKVQLKVREEGTLITFHVDGVDVLDGPLAHQVKPGNEIWMLEDAPDGSCFAVAELDKLTVGIEWTSVLRPEVSFVGDYREPVVELPTLDKEEEDATVMETLLHLQRKQGTLVSVEGRAAQKGDVLTIDMQGYELTDGGLRGKKLDVGSATALKMELGGQGFPAEMQDQLVGIQKDESRDIQVTLGQRAGGLGGQRIICAVVCKDIQEQQLPELDNEFAREIKRKEQFIQAGTIEGIPEEEQGLAEVFTLDALKAEIVAEVRQTAEKQAETNIDTQLEDVLLNAAEVRCDFATVDGNGKPAELLQRQERLAVVIDAVLEREGLNREIDMNEVNRETWDVLGTPPAGKTIAEVGRDPAREFQVAFRKVLRKKQREKVMAWLRPQAKIVPMGEGQ